MLLAAIHAGCYEIPRWLTAEQLAERVELARSTFQEHLRKGEGAVMGGFAQLLIDHSALVTNDLKGRGRPSDKPGLPDPTS